MSSIKESFGRLRAFNTWEVVAAVSAILLGACRWYFYGEISNEWMFVVMVLLAASLLLAVYRALSFIIGLVVMMRNLIDFFSDRIK